MHALCISACASNQGKTILSTALLYHYKNKVRPFKIGPDFIDPLFHEKISKEKSINLDTYIMNKEQVKWMFDKYANKDFNILEGVMGFYDGMDKNASAYDVSSLLKIPSVIILDASGSYITLAAVLQGLCNFREDNTIKAVIFNKVASQSHYDLINTCMQKECSNIVSLGWIKKDLDVLDSTHLGLSLDNNNYKLLEKISKDVLEHINLEKLERISVYKKAAKSVYPFIKQEKVQKSIAIVNDDNFCFLYYDNVVFLKEVFEKVFFISAIDDEVIPDVDVVYIPGGYVETKLAYDKIKDSNSFRTSLIKHGKNKAIYAECAGLLYLGENVDDKRMSALLPLEFTLLKKAARMGYYKNDLNITGHAFHYTQVKNEVQGEYTLYKKASSKASYAAFKHKKVFGTYLHTMFRNNFHLIKRDFALE